MKTHGTSEQRGLRAKCPRCGRMILQRADGKLRTHQGPDPTGISGMDCNGSGKKPAVEKS